MGAASLAALACGGNESIPAPRPAAVEPARGFVGNRTSVTIRGDDFVVRAVRSTSGGAPRVDTAYRAWLGEVELEDVLWVDPHTLRATVPAGLPTGPQPLAVENPFAARGHLDAAFDVVDTSGAVLTVAVEPAATLLSVGQSVDLRATVTNIGSADATDVAAAAWASSTDGAAMDLAGPQPASAPRIGPGESREFVWNATAAAPGEIILAASATGTDVFSGEGIEGSSPQGAITIQLPAGLAATIAADRATANPGQAVALTFRVTNGGSATADISAVTPSAAPQSAVDCGTPSPAPPQSIGSGESVTFTWTCTSSEPGTLGLSATAAGTDANSGEPIDATPAAPAVVAVQRPAALTADIALPAGTNTVSVGQAVDLALTVRNEGGAGATLTAVAPTVTPGNGAVCGAARPTPPRSLGGGAQTTFDWSCTVAITGTIAFGAAVAGADGNTGAALSASPSPGATVTSQLPAALTAVVGASRALASVGQAVTVDFTVTNGGSAAANVASVTPSTSGTASASCGAATPAPPQTIPSGQSRVFSWTCTASTPGSLALSGTASGVDVNSGASLSATPSTAAAVTVQAPASLAATSFAASRTTANVGQPVSVTLTLANTGGASATVHAVSPMVAPGSAGCTTASPVPPQTLAGGKTLTFVWSCTATVTGSHSLGATVTASDANSGAPLAPAVGTVSFTAQSPAALSVTSFTSGAATANVGQAVAVTLTLRNTGGATANVSAVTRTVNPSAGTGCTALSPTVPRPIAGGASQTFTWSCSASSTGSYTLRSTVTAADANTGATLSPSLAPIPLTVQTPAALTATIAAAGSPATISVGQPLTLLLTVANGGGAGANVTDVTPTVSPAGSAACSAPTPAPPRPIAGGSSDTFSFTCAPAVAGSFTFGANVAGTDANDGAPLAATASPGYAVTAQLPAALAATVSANRAVASAGQAITVTFTVTNGGAAPANLSAVTPSATGTASATCGAVTPALPRSVASGQAQVFGWTCTPTSAGSLALSGTATGTDANSGSAVSATPASAATVTVQTPAALSVTTFSASRATVNVGQAVGVTLTLANTGGAAASVSAVAPSRTPAATASCTAASPAPPRTIAGGASLTFTWSCTASAAGSYGLGASIAATDANSGANVAPSPASLTVAVQTAAALSVTAFSAGATSANVGQAVALSLTLANTGGATANVSAVNPAMSPSAGTSCTAASPAPQPIVGGASRTFTWTCSASTTGSYTLGATVAATDANSGGALSPTVPSLPVSVQRPATLSASLSIQGNPTVVSVGQALSMTLTVQNGGGAAASLSAVTPTVTPLASAACAAASPVPPRTVVGGGNVAFTWSCTPAVAGSITFGATVAGTDANDGTPLSATASPGVTVTAQLPAAIAATIGASRTVATVGQAITVTFTVANGGSAAANLTSVAPSASGAGTTCGAVSPALPSTVPSGQSRAFTWTCTPSAAGALTLSGTASGTDANSGAPLSATPATPASATVQTPPALTATAFAASPTTANVGQAIAVTLTLANGGGATADISAATPTFTPPAGGTCTAATPAAPRSIAGGANLTLTWSCSGTAAGSASLGAAVDAKDANTGTTTPLSVASIPVTVQTPAALAATAFSAAPSTVNTGQTIAVSLTLASTGGATARVDTVTPTATPPAAASCTVPAPAPPQAIAGGANRVFTWSCTASAAGALTLGATVAGTDANTGAPLAPSISGVGVTVLAPAALSATAAIGGDPTTVSVGQALSVTVTVTNGGGAGATVTAVTPTVTGTAAATCGTPAPAPPRSLAGGASLAFTWSCTPSSAGPLTLGAIIAGTDAVSAAPLSTSAGRAVEVQTAAGLSASLSAARAVASVGQSVGVTLTVSNGGAASADVTTVSPSTGGTATATCTAPIPAPPLILAGGQSRDLTWSCTASAAGTLTLGASVAGSDANSGAPLGVTPTTASVTVQTPAALTATAFTASPTTAVVGQAIDVSLTLANGGGAPANVSAVGPTVTPPASGTCTATAPAPPRTIAGGASLGFTWTCTLTVAGSATLGATVSATDANSGAPASATVPAIPVTVLTPASLTVTAFTLPSTATVGQAIPVSLTLANGGGGAADVTAVTPVVTPTPNAVCAAASPAPPQTIPGGSSLTFAWSCTASQPGSNYNFRANVAAVDASSGASLSPTVPNVGMTVVAPAALTATVAVTGSPTIVSVGQNLTVTLTLGNTGAAAADVATVTPTATGTATAICGIPDPAPPLTVTSSGNAVLAWTCTPSSAGTLTLGASVTGADAVSGAPISASPTAPQIGVQSAAALAATIASARSVVSVGQAVAMTFTVTNAGGAAANVTAITPVASGTAAASCGAPSPAPPFALAGGLSRDVTWSCVPSSAGTVQLGGGVNGTDANSGATVSASAPVPASVTVQSPAALAATVALTGSPANVNVGQGFAVVFAVTNTGGATAQVTAVTPSVTGTGAATCGATSPSPPQDIAGGATLSFGWSCTATVAGTLTVGGSAAGSDANSGAALGASASPTATLGVQTPAALSASAFSATPATVTTGQPVSVSLTLANTGGATAIVEAVAPTVTPSASASCTAAAPAPPQNVAGGAGREFTWTCTPSAAGALTLGATVAGTDANSRAALAPVVPGAPATVVTPAVLTATAAIEGSPSTVSVGQALSVTLTLDNTGGASADVATVTPTVAGTGTATCSTPSPAPPRTVAGGGKEVLAWSCTPTSAGTLTLGASVTGTDAVSSAPLSASPTAPQVTVQTPAALSVTAFSASRTAANVGQAVSFTLTLANGGGATADVSAVTPTVTPPASASCTAVAPAPPLAIAGAGSQPFTWTCTPSTAGTITFGATVAARDANSGTSIDPAVTGVAVVAETPAAVSVTSFTASPTTAIVGQAITVTLVLANTGGATATTTVTPSATPPDVTTCGTPTPAATQPITGSSSATYTWSCSATAPAAPVLGGSVVALDANSGADVGPALTGIPVTIQASLGQARSSLAPAPGNEVVLVAEDPFGDGTPRAALAPYRGSVIAGLGGAGRWLVRLDPAGGPAERLDLALGVDAGPTPAANAAWLASAPATTLGEAGCAAGTQACGPDDEAGLAVLGSGSWGGLERLWLAGVGPAGTRYLYASASATTPLEASWIDLRAALGEAGTSIDATLPPAEPADGLYLATRRAGEARLVAVLAPPADHDGRPGTEVVDLGAAGAAGARVTALAGMGGVLYAAGDRGFARLDAGGWMEATPSASAFAARASTAEPAGRSWPGDRAVPAAATFGACGTEPCLLVARNVAGEGGEPPVVPQLWRCAPGAGRPACAPDDWVLVAPDAVDGQATRIGSSAHGAASMLVATPGWLYVGFDDGGAGIQVYRAARSPGLASDFEGRGGCTAGVASCEGLGGNGFGLPGLTRISGATTLSVDGLSSVWIAAGDGVSPVRIFRIDEPPVR